MKFVIIIDKAYSKKEILKAIAEIPDIKTAEPVKLGNVDFSKIESDEYKLWHGIGSEKQAFTTDSLIDATVIITEKYENSADLVRQIINEFKNEPVSALLCVKTDGDGSYAKPDFELISTLEGYCDKPNYCGTYIVSDEQDIRTVQQIAQTVRDANTQLKNMELLIKQAKALGILNSRIPDTAMIVYSSETGEPIGRDIPDAIAASMILRDDQGLAALMRNWLAFPVCFDLPMNLRTERNDDNDLD